ncbi:TetR family transcriptional regulator [Paractinoplanes hotanensis]|uniref:TetR/AcrR family transcriptional regulator n=1 Tax=Paractinoplanes hotanensis TaxID=2906497 RepID=A0ABT0XUU0_9ACTN|nr:TetR family transcriptional regulator [Actinoplanes hotanensis]MCM4077548.1 TetR/AcrR family transcriptional regulator [Actinoplanes hotanensis]
MANEGMWNRTRQAAIAEISAIAMDLFLERGFEVTTFDDIATAAGISRRSLFRYFGTKEDIVLVHLADEGKLALEALEARPDDEPVWTALLNVLLLIDDGGGDRERLLKISEMMYDVPSLRSRSLEKHLQWQSDLLPEVKRRLGAASGDLQAAAVIASAVACLDAAGEIWTRSRGQIPLSHLLTDAFDAVQQAAR